MFNTPAMSHTHPLTTTTFELPGYRVIKSLGVVRGIIVRSRSIIGNIGADIQSIFGGNISLYTELCERTRGGRLQSDARHTPATGRQRRHWRALRRHGDRAGITEVLCYGTAVFVEPAQKS